MSRLCFLLLLVPSVLASFQRANKHLVGRAPTSSSVRALFANSPNTYPIEDQTPQPRPAWIEAYTKAKKAGQIPTIPPTTIVNYYPVYPAAYKGNPCSFYLNKCNATSDITTGPSGVAGIAFDDGPQPPSSAMIALLKKQKVTATHFLIGSRIKDNLDIFAQTVSSGGHLAVHTWSHPYMTSLTDLQVVAELGWTMQIIVDKSGKYPAFWRPPYGDVDNRVRAIAKQIFGLTTVTWSQDARDWCLSDASGSGSACGVGNGPQNLADLNGELSNWILHTPKQNGLIILEHEIGSRMVDAFQTTMPLYQKAKWTLKAIPDMKGLKWYQ